MRLFGSVAVKGQAECGGFGGEIRCVESRSTLLPHMEKALINTYVNLNTYLIDSEPYYTRMYR